MNEVRYAIQDLSKLEHKLIINALKIWRGDFGDPIQTSIWLPELQELLDKLGYPEKGWKGEGER